MVHSIFISSDLLAACPVPDSVAFVAQVLRVKIESLMGNPGVPITDAEAAALSPSNYFEFHWKLKLPVCPLPSALSRPPSLRAALFRGLREWRGRGRSPLSAWQSSALERGRFEKEVSGPPSPGAGLTAQSPSKITIPNRKTNRAFFWITNRSVSDRAPPPGAKLPLLGPSIPPGLRHSVTEGRSATWEG